MVISDSRAPLPPPVVHEQLAVHLLVAPGGLHGVQQLLGLDELWVPLPVFWPGHQASDVGPLPLDLRVHGGCGNDTAGTGELVRAELTVSAALVAQLQGKGFGCSAALGKLPDFPSLGFLICEMEMIDSLCPGRKDWGSWL